MLLLTASCSLDIRAINTFDNKTYPVKLGKCWHVALLTTPDEESDSRSNENEEDDDVAVLIRDYDSNNHKVLFVHAANIAYVY
jgi:hypothetical protein